MSSSQTGLAGCHFHLYVFSSTFVFQSLVGDVVSVHESCSFNFDLIGSNMTIIFNRRLNLISIAILYTVQRTCMKRTEEKALHNHYLNYIHVLYELQLAFNKEYWRKMKKCSLYLSTVHDPEIWKLLGNLEITRWWETAVFKDIKKSKLPHCQLSLLQPFRCYKSKDLAPSWITKVSRIHTLINVRRS